MNVPPATSKSFSGAHGDRPSIHLHIERLVLDGLPVNHHEGAFVQAAIGTELTRLLAEQGVNPSSAGAFAHWSGGSIQLAHDSSPANLGHQIAQAIHTGLKPAPTSPRVIHSPGGAAE